MEVYKRGENPKLYTTCREETHNDDGTLSDGDLVAVGTSMQCIIEDNNGEVVQALDDASTDDTGKYYYSGYNIAADAKLGIYHYEFRATDGSSQVATDEGYFEVKEQIS